MVRSPLDTLTRATKTGVAPTIDRLERCIVWRRSLRLDDVDMLDKETEVEVRGLCGARS